MRPFSLAAAAARPRCRSRGGLLVGGVSMILALVASLLLRSLRPAAVPYSNSHNHIKGGTNGTDTRLKPDLDIISIQSNATEPSIEMRNLPGLGGTSPLHGQWDGYAAIVTLPSGMNATGLRPIFTVLEPIGGCTSHAGHLSKTSTNAKQNDCRVAINGSPFDRGGGCIGQSMSNGRPVCKDCGVWAGIPSIGLSTTSMESGLTAATWVIGTGINHTFAESIGVENLLVGHVPGWLIRNGTVQISSNYSDPTPAPRTALGVTADGSRLIMLVVDGCEHCPRFMGGAQGLTVHELAVEMQKLGAAFAINLDGGGSSTLFTRKGVVNYPVSFDYAPIFHERSVSTVLCIRVE
eukprot:CAMPEP_0181029068 /NCGR_PEP_ID=MMETSP1070-20121207/5000_1 /TAXON_ID=265543 /ORGANISM="Minutocellus polymorphus, Strain NH13" /LENGTH=349 /DNA_ID=CAMNT_0023106351 /DNA_START=138 /DNA_END=1187 /DNA_ORIENTATION=+